MLDSPQVTRRESFMKSGGSCHSEQIKESGALRGLASARQDLRRNPRSADVAAFRKVSGVRDAKISLTEPISASSRLLTESKSSSHGGSTYHWLQIGSRLI